MSNRLVGDPNAHIQTEREAEEVVHKNKGLQQHRLFLSRLQILGLDPDETANDNGKVERDANNDRGRSVNSRQASGGRRAGELRVEDIAHESVHSLGDVNV